MAASVRLNRELESRLAAYCAQHGVSKTEVIVRGLELLLERGEERGAHPAYAAFERIARRLRAEPRRSRNPSSGDALRRAMRAKYPA